MRSLILAALALLTTLMAPTSHAQTYNGFDPRGGPSIPSIYSVQANPWNGGGRGGGWGASPWAPWDGVGGFQSWNETSSGRTKQIKLPNGRKVRAQFCPRDANGRPIGWVMFGVSCTQQNAERFTSLLYGAYESPQAGYQPQSYTPQSQGQQAYGGAPAELLPDMAQQQEAAPASRTSCRKDAAGTQMCRPAAGYPASVAQRPARTAARQFSAPATLATLPEYQP